MKHFGSKILFIQFLLLFFTNVTFSQAQESITTFVEIIGKGNDSNNNPCDNCYYTRFEIINNEDTTLPIVIWNCSWGWNWISNNDSINVIDWPCDSNSEIVVDVPAKQSLIFYGGIFISPQIKTTAVKFGFSNGNEKFTKRFRLSRPRKPNGKLYWSNSISLRKNYLKIADYLPEYFVTNHQ